MRPFAAGDLVRAKNAILLIVLLRIIMGGFWISHSHDKWGWFASGELQQRLTRYHEDAEGVQKLYLEKFALPYWRVLQYLVVFGELAVGLSFLLGTLTRLAAIGGVFMAASFLLAQGALLDWSIIGNPYGPVTMMATIVAAYCGGELRWSLYSWLAGKQPLLPTWDPK